MKRFTDWCGIGCLLYLCRFDYISFLFLNIWVKKAGEHECVMCKICSSINTSYNWVPVNDLLCIFITSRYKEIRTTKTHTDMKRMQLSNHPNKWESHILHLYNNTEFWKTNSNGSVMLSNYQVQLAVYSIITTTIKNYI